MKKSIIIGIVVVLIASAGVLSVLKLASGDEVIDLPGEEQIEKALNLREEYSENDDTDIEEYEQR